VDCGSIPHRSTKGGCHERCFVCKRAPGFGSGCCPSFRCGPSAVLQLLTGFPLHLGGVVGVLESAKKMIPPHIFTLLTWRRRRLGS
jgi:hypothetical protein